MIVRCAQLSAFAMERGPWWLSLPADAGQHARHARKHDLQRRIVGESQAVVDWLAVSEQLPAQRQRTLLVDPQLLSDRARFRPCGHPEILVLSGEDPCWRAVEGFGTNR